MKLTSSYSDNLWSGHFRAIWSISCWSVWWAETSIHSLKHGQSKADIHLWLTMLSSCCAWRLKLAFKLMPENAREVETSGLLLMGFLFWAVRAPCSRATWDNHEAGGEPDYTGETGLVVSSTFPPESYLLERSIWFFASVFFSSVSLKEGELGLLSERGFQNRNVDRRIGAVQQFSGLIVFGIVHVHSVVTARRGWGKRLMMTQEIPWYGANKGQNLKRSKGRQYSCAHLSRSLPWNHCASSACTAMWSHRAWKDIGGGGFKPN